MIKDRNDGKMMKDRNDGKIIVRNRNNSAFIFTVAFSVLVLVLLLSGVASAGTSSFVNYQARPGIQSVYGGQVSTYWPILADRESCYDRNDILLNAVPFGCEPSVVRSDLLAEQNVPVFCKISAANINPLLDIKGIRDIRFTSNRPREVVGTAFHPAKAALRSDEKLLGSPLADEIGYVVVVLRRQENESALPDSVNVTLGARMQYESGNSLGIGRAEFKLEEISDDEWEVEKNRQSFWNGRFSVRAARIGPDKATVAIYYADKLYSTVTVEKGKFAEVGVPGSYCQTKLRIYYDGFEANRDRAEIEISDDEGSDVLWVYEGSKFLNGQCTVEKIGISEDNISGSLDYRCRSRGEEGRLELRARSGDDSASGGGSGDGGEGGTNGASDDDETQPSLEDKTLSGGEDEFNEVVDAFKRVVEEYPVEELFDSESKEAKYYGEEALIEAIEMTKKVGVKEKTYAELLILFLERYPDSELALKYEDELRKLYAEDQTLAGTAVEVNNRFFSVRVLGFKKKLGNPASAVFSLIGGKSFTLGLGNFGNSSGDVEREKKFNDDGLEKIILEEILSEDEVKLRVYCREKKNGVAKAEDLIAGRGGVVELCRDPGVKIKLERIEDFDPVASVRIEPSSRGTQSDANLTISIGIEKRGIKLSPDKINEKLKNLNESVQKWESLSNKLGKVVKGLKVACFTTSAALIVKNFVSGMDGTAMARQDAMGHWRGKCEELGYSSITQCLNKNENRDAFEAEVKARTAAIKSTNNLIEGAQSRTGGDPDGGIVISDDETNAALITDLRREYGENVIEKDAKDYVSMNDLRELAYYSEMKEQGLGDVVKNDLDRVNGRIADAGARYDEKVASSEAGGFLGRYSGQSPAARESGSEPMVMPFLSVESGKLNGKDVTINENGGSLEGGNSAVIVSGADNKNYLIVGDNLNGKISSPGAVYEYKEDSGGTINLTKIDNVTINNFMTEQKIRYFREEGSDFNNPINSEHLKIRYFGAGPDSGMAGVVPFDKNEGWYAKVVSFSNSVPAYDASGMPRTWQICNVMDDGRIDSSDECQTVFTGHNEQLPILGLSASKSSRLIRDARQALLEANSQRGNKIVRILGESFLQGSPVSQYDPTECQDFMSVDDCKLLFNVCDPVICPPTRCDLGGEYPVADVIQTGIVGSALLCLPNIKEEVYIPVCLSGIKAGIDGYVSILKSHQQCLEENLATGRTIGICDEIYSVYMCDFFWRQVTPVAREVLPKLLSGQFLDFGGTHGGGEYRTVAGAWDATDKSINYFTQTYAVNSLDAFKARSIEQVGTEFCKAFVSLNAPTDFESLVEPDSPPQFHAWFSSTTYTTATVPATAQYKVFYHIFAGADRGASFSVYLKDAPEGSYYSVPARIQVASGFVGQGDFATETKDFTAPEGYKQLCVRINNDEECGFKQVSSSFAVNYLRDKVVGDELQNKDIQSAKECISGGSNPAALLLNPNVQAGAEESLDSAIYNRGITRVCSTQNPGGSTDPTRFVNVGTCDGNMICWLDKNSVEDAVTKNNVGLKNETLSVLEARQNELALSDENLLGIDEARGKLDKWEASLKDSSLDFKDLIKRVSAEFDEIYFAHQKARALLIIAKARERIFGIAFKKVAGSGSGGSGSTNGADGGSGGAGGG